MAGEEEEYFGVDEDAVTYAGRPVAAGSEQDRISRAMRRHRQRAAEDTVAKNDMIRALNGGSPTNPDNLNAALSSGRLKVSQVPVLPVASGPYMGTEAFTQAAGAPSSLPNGFGIQPQAWGTGNRRQRVFERTLERQAADRDEAVLRHDLRREDAVANDGLKRAFELFKNNLPPSAKMRFAAYVRSQAANAKSSGVAEKPASWLDINRFREWEREEREIEYRQTVLDKGEDSDEAKAIAKRINIDPSKKWISEQREKKTNEEQAARIDLAKAQAAAANDERATRKQTREEAEKAKVVEREQRALGALRKVREDAYRGVWSRAMEAVRNSPDTAFLPPDQMIDAASALARKLFKTEVRRLLRGVSPEELDLIKKHGLDSKLFEDPDEIEEAGAAGAAGAAPAPASAAGAAPGAPPIPAGGAPGAGGAGGAGAAGGGGVARPAPMTRGARLDPTALPAPLPAGTARGSSLLGSEGNNFGRKAIGSILPKDVQANEVVKVGDMDVIIDTPGYRSLKQGTFYTDQQGRQHWRGGDENGGAAEPWDTERAGAAGGMAFRQSVEARERLKARPNGQAVVTGDMSEYAGADASTLESIAKHRAAGVGDKAGALLREDERRVSVATGSVDGGGEMEVDASKASKRDLDAATRLLMGMTPPARAQELAKMRASPQAYLAKGVPVQEILAMYDQA